MMQKIPHQGQLYRSPNTDIGFFDQQAAELDPENTVLEELWKRFPKMHEAEVRSALGRVLLRGEEVYKKVGVISGGERARLNFAILMVEHPNVRLLDEPTNHLDLDTKEQLEKAL
ncbi:MAG TPA: ABC transporter, partial [Ruminococcaceae bacterium]|nr:ABC transporter [Oscillospiraceae bacterium]